jgi:hypothetical protein
MVSVANIWQHILQPTYGNNKKRPQQKRQLHPTPPLNLREKLRLMRMAQGLLQALRISRRHCFLHLSSKKVETCGNKMKAKNIQF